MFVKLANTGEIRSEYENELRKVSGYMFIIKFLHRHLMVTDELLTDMKQGLAKACLLE